MAGPRSRRDEPDQPSLRDSSRPLPPRPVRHEARPGPGKAPGSERERRTSQPGSLRTLALFSGIAATSALATAMLPSVAPAADAGGASQPPPAPARVADTPAPSVRHVTRYVVLKPGQTAPPNAPVLVRPTPTPRVTVVTRTRQSGKP